MAAQVDEMEEERKEEEKKEEESENDHIDPQQLKDYEYECVGVVVHSGGAEGGHYYSFIKDRSTNHWFEFNDTNVTPFDIKDLKDETFGGDSKSSNVMGNTGDFYGDATYARSRNAYLLIYQRKYPKELASVVINDPNNDYVKGIPKSVYQHIWNENMLFMKRMYFFDSEYLHFVRGFITLNNFERKVYISDSLTKELKVKSEVAKMLAQGKQKEEQVNMNVEDDEEETIVFNK
jgi:hypothetical protein